MQYHAITTLAKQLEIKPSDLFEKFQSFGWIERKNEKWKLTELGKKMGGQTRTSPKTGEYVVWPENISIPGGKEKAKGKMLNASAIGEYFGISASRLNLILSELGWTEKAYIGQNANGWAVTKLGKGIGGKQLEHEISGNTFVLWPESILQNPSLMEVFNYNNFEKGSIVPPQLPPPLPPPIPIPIPIPIPVLEQIASPVQTATSKVETPKKDQEPNKDYREKWEAKHRTLDGHYVRSRAEVLIDNLLYYYGLVHAYERKIFIGDEEVLTDFYLPNGKVYIEFWGLEEDPKYAARKKKKIDFYKENGFNLIELKDEDILSLDDHLPRKLKNFGIKVY